MMIDKLKLKLSSSITENVSQLKLKRRVKHMMKQKEAVYQAIVNVIGGEPEGKVELTKEQRAQVRMVLTEGFKAKRIELEKDFTEAKLNEYVSGLVSNWLRKDPRLNGGRKYEPKNPGSRVGNTDPTLRALRALLSTKTDQSARAEIQGFIDQRLAEIRSAKATTVQIDVSALPEGARKFVS